MNPEKLRKECPTDTELHRICDVLRDCAIEDGEMWADIEAKGDNRISVEVHDGETVRILKGIIGKIEQGRTSGPCMDINGNKVGQWFYDPPDTRETDEEED